MEVGRVSLIVYDGREYPLLEEPAFIAAMQHVVLQAARRGEHHPVWVCRTLRSDRWVQVLLGPGIPVVLEISEHVLDDLPTLDGALWELRIPRRKGDRTDQRRRELGDLAELLRD